MIFIGQTESNLPVVQTMPPPPPMKSEQIRLRLFLLGLEDSGQICPICPIWQFHWVYG